MIAIPNISEGRRADLINDLRRSISPSGLLDVHSDPAHNRSVFTIAGDGATLVEAAVRLAQACRALDLTTHSGVHPRLGVLDVFPVVLLEEDAGPAIACARQAAQAIWEGAGIPVYLYGEAAVRRETRALPDIRAGGLERLAQRAATDLPPDIGSPDIDPRYGVVCAGARGPLIAFNVLLDAPRDIAQRIAERVRSSAGGPPGVRALALAMDARTSQVSMNLTEPDVTGIDEVFGRISSLASAENVRVTATEIVGLPLERHLPDPKREAARLLIEPSRSLESVLL